jgi:Family of unknown function (DUF6011)
MNKRDMRGEMTRPHLSPVPAELRNTEPKITTKQRNYLLDLIRKKQIKEGQEGKLDLLMKSLRISEDPEEFGLSKAKASELIEWFRKQPDKPLGSDTSTGDVPDGYYALRGVEGHKNDISFFRLRSPGPMSNWHGRQFVDQVVGHGKRYPVKEKATRDKIYNLIREQGINEARQLYGQEIGQCGRCGRELTDDTSRARGIGPDCWGMMS